MRTRAGYCYPSPDVGDLRENRKRKRQTMSREEMNGNRLRRETNGVNHFDDLPDDLLISVLAEFSTSTKYAAEFVNVLLTCKRFHTLGHDLLVLRFLPREKFYQRLQNMKEMYCPELKDLLSRLSMGCQRPMAPDLLKKLKFYITTLQRVMAYLEAQKNSIPLGFKEAENYLDTFDKQIQAILNEYKLRISGSQQQQGR